MTNKREHPKLIGDRSTAMVLARLLEVYEVVLLPFGENQRYDLVIEDGDSFIRVQCKTGRLHAGAVSFHACSSTYHHPNASAKDFRSHDYRGQADYFGVYCSDTDAVYLVPVDEVGKRGGSLRVAPPRNNQRRRIRWADDYIVPGKGVPISSAGTAPPFEGPDRYAVQVLPG